jgi:hypothetical protein
MLNVAMGLSLLGVSLVNLAWIFCRKPKVSFWTFGTIFHLMRFLTPLGLTLCKIGLMLMCIGFLVCLVWLQQGYSTGNW